MDYLITFGVPAILILLTFLIVGFAFTRIYHRSTREMSLVRTGSGGRKIIMDGGIIVIPGLHELTRINMQTTRLEVQRTGSSALITLDRMRVDVGVEFYVTVQSNEEGIARAAQTLGRRTGNMEALREMIEGKLVDGLRAVAAQMKLDDLHENRSAFVQQVQTAVSEDLKKNGLELEAVSLTALDQTPMEALDENNVFNAMGMKNQVERIAESRKRRAEIEAETEVAVARSRQEAEVHKYEIERGQEEARVNQAVEFESLRAREATDKARKSEEAMREAEQARIDRVKQIEIAEQDRQIAVQRKSQEESQARADADLARAAAVKAEEEVKTAREVAEAERRKRIVILAAEQEAEESATQIRVSAKAEREAADDRAAAMREQAQAEADSIRIRAQADKEAKLAEAEGTRELIAAENTLSLEIIDFRLHQQRLKAMPGIIAEMVKPAEKIGTISIHKIDGFGGTGGGQGQGADGARSGGSGGSDLVGQAFDEMRQMAVQMPALRAIGQKIGLNMNATMSDMVSEVMAVEPKAPLRHAAVSGGSAQKTTKPPAKQPAPVGMTINKSDLPG